MGGGGGIGPPFQRPNSKTNLKCQKIWKKISIPLLCTVHCVSVFIKTIQFVYKIHLKRPIQKVGVQKAAVISNVVLRYTYFKIT
jgi:hypothetical protein